MAKVADPIIELLAIKLYEHDTVGGRKAAQPGDRNVWAEVDEEDRESYRAMARGEVDLYVR